MLASLILLLYPSFTFNRKRTSLFKYKQHMGGNSFSTEAGEELIQSARHGDKEGMIAAIRGGAKISYHGNALYDFANPLMVLAGWNDRPDLVHWYLSAAEDDSKKRGSKQRLVDKVNGWTGQGVLHYSIRGNQGSAANIHVLLRFGADPNQRTAGGSASLSLSPGITPLMLAAQTGDIAKVEVLLRAGADPALQNKDGKTALGYTQNGNPKRPCFFDYDHPHIRALLSDSRRIEQLRSEGLIDDHKVTAGGGQHTSPDSRSPPRGRQIARTIARSESGPTESADRERYATSRAAGSGTHGSGGVY